jgi:hypothetical protein
MKNNASVKEQTLEKTRTFGNNTSGEMRLLARNKP